MELGSKALHVALPDGSYATFLVDFDRTPPGPAEVRQLSPLSAELLSLCEGSLTVEEIAAEFRQNKIEVSGVPADKLCLAGLEILRQQRLIGLA